MRSIVLLPLLLFLGFPANAQKEDFVWLLGYTPNEPAQKFGGTKIDFHQSLPNISFFNIPFRLFPIGMINNPSGVVQFYSNGCSIANRENQIMLNGNGINAGYMADAYCVNGGYPFRNGLLSLSLPADTNNFVFFHLWGDNSTLYKRLQYTKIDMTLDNGLGAVTSKNEIALQDTFTDHLTAVRHGNGRDWWIAAHKGRSNRSLLFLLDHDGLHAPIAQHIGPVWGPRDWSGQSVFSPDGRQYARANPDNGLNLFDFDRCTGAFSNPIVVSLAADSASAAGVAFSPNSRFLYLSTGLKLFQFDMQAPNIPASKQLIGVYDGFLGPFPTSFYQMRLAPNGKIYMGATNGVRYLHTIHQPDMPGAACNFVQHDLELPTHFAIGLPNFPYFRLYDEPGSPCDTLGINGGPWWTSTGAAAESQIQVRPNPFRERFTLALSVNLRSPALRLHDAAGRLVLEQRLVLGVNEIEAAGLPAGLYFWEVAAAGERVKSGKLVKTDKP
jgi:hypothetical protein